MLCSGASRVLFIFLPLVCAFGEAGAPEAVISQNPSPAPPAMVIGFVGGFVRHDSRTHSAVQLVERLQREFHDGTYAAAFENRKRDKAFRDILRRLDANHDGTLSREERASARIVVFGHSWGASEAVALARKLEKMGIPILLTVQVDSVAKIGQNDQLIPANVEEAVNFFQPHGLIHGRRQIRAADPGHTRILGNYLFDYTKHPLRCEGVPWFNRWFMKSHIQIECDPEVWSQVQSLISAKLAGENRWSASR